MLFDAPSSSSSSCLYYIGEPHKPSGYEQRTMLDGAISVTIGGVELEPGKPLGVLINTDLTFKVTTRQEFKGIMARISGGDENVNTKEVFILRDDDLDLKINSECDLNVSSILASMSNTNARVSSCNFAYTHRLVVLHMPIPTTRNPLNGPCILPKRPPT